jgi:Gpi18-like mannosyltransferase
VLLLLSPTAIFLAAGYTDALFLGFALPAWLAARRGHWLAAGLLVAGAASTRVTGVFLAVALAVEFLTATDGRRRRWRSGPRLLVPLAPVAASMVYLHNRTGDWLAWQHPQQRGWRRTFTYPWNSLENTWNAAFGGE